MKTGHDIFTVFVSVSVFSVLLIVFSIFLARYLKRKEPPVEHIEMNSVMGAFNALGSEIKSLREQLVMKERLAALGEVSAGIAHEFRNPMGVIAGYARLLLKGLEESDGRRELVQGILTEVEEMNRVMEELLKFSKSESVKKVELDLARLLREIVGGMEDMGHRVDFPAGDAVAIKGDETLLKQAISNLLRNAVQAGNKVRLSLEPAHLQGKEGVCVAVKDNGAGIPAESFEKIFMPFYTTKNGGSGIGLALVQKIAPAHGGSVSVNSKEGKGSTFRLFLPFQ